MTGADLRRDFAAALGARDQLRGERASLTTGLRPAFAGRVREYTGWRGDDFTMERRAHKTMEPWEVREILRPLWDAWTSGRTRLGAELRGVEHELQELAYRLDPVRGDEWLPYRTFRCVNYRSDERATRARAEIEAFDVRERSAFPVRVVRVEHEPVMVRALPREQAQGKTDRLHRRPPDYRVEVQVADVVDVEIIRRTPGPTLAEMVSEARRRGVDPRGIWPLLPLGRDGEVAV